MCATSFTFSYHKRFIPTSFYSPFYLWKDNDVQFPGNKRVSNVPYILSFRTPLLHFLWQSSSFLHLSFNCITQKEFNRNTQKQNKIVTTNISIPKTQSYRNVLHKGRSVRGSPLPRLLKPSSKFCRRSVNFFLSLYSRIITLFQVFQ